MKLAKLIGIFIFLSALIPSQIFAHALWKPGSLTTPPRSTDMFANLKFGPCGGTDPDHLPRSTNPITYKAGETINAEFIETIFHPGEFWISYSEKNEENFMFKKTIPHSVTPNDTYVTPYTLPIELCADCTLQLIQLMTDNPANPYYYSCSDIILESPDIADTTTQGTVTVASAASGDGSVTLNWTNPIQDLNNPALNFYKVIIISNTVAITTTANVELSKNQFNVGDILNANNDKVEYIGYDSTKIISNLMNDTEYNFKIFAYDINLNYSTDVAISAIPSAANVAPSVSLLVKQGKNNSTTVFKDATDIFISAIVIDGNIDDTHTFVWTSEGNILRDADNNLTDNKFTISSTDAINLDPGNYKLSVVATDNGVGNLTGSTSVDITLSNLPQVGDIVVSESSGGCSVSKSAKFDPLLLLLSLLSIIIIGFKIRRNN